MEGAKVRIIFAGDFHLKFVCRRIKRILSDRETMYVTYQDLIQIGILVVALANLIYQVCKEKKK